MEVLKVGAMLPLNKEKRREAQTLINKKAGSNKGPAFLVLLRKELAKHD